MWYMFQETQIWEGTDKSPDPGRKQYRRKGKTEERARKLLPQPGLGREWVLVSSEEKAKVDD